MKKVKVLSCDLSLTGSAFALSVFYEGKIQSTEIIWVNNKKNNKEGLGKRLKNIADTFEEILKNNPDIDIIVRERGFSRHHTTTQLLFRVVGVFDLVSHTHAPKTPVEEITPLQVKKVLTGSGTKDKKQVEEAVKLYTGDIEFESDDCSDAVAVGIACAIGHNLIQRVEQ